MTLDHLAIFLCSLLICIVSGCDRSFFSKQDSSSDQNQTADSERGLQTENTQSQSWEIDESADGDRSTGLNGGHVFDFEPSRYRGEWISYDDNNITRVFILNSNATQNVPVKVESIWVKKPDNSIFSLDPENPGDTGETPSYILDDRNLAVAMILGVTVEMKIGEQTYRATIPKLEK